MILYNRMCLLIIKSVFEFNTWDKGVKQDEQILHGYGDKGKQNNGL